MKNRKFERGALPFFFGMAGLRGRRFWLVFSAFVLAFSIPSSPSYSQISEVTDSEIAPQTEIEEAKAEIDRLQDAIVSLINASRGLDGGSRDPAYQKIDIKYYELWAEHNLNVFKWTIWESRILLAVVLLIVGCGLYFAYIQLKSSIDVDVPSIKPGESTPPALISPSRNGETTLGLSLSSVNLKSSIVGLIILALSLGFFYLYLKEVFPLRIVDPSSGKVVQVKQ